jgi:predicted aspartyl protease
LGTFFHPITLIAPSGATETLEALVDTGAAFTTVPAPVLERMGVRSHRTAKLRLADGDVVEWRLGWVTAEIDGSQEEILCVFGSADAPPAIGAHTLETFLLGVDPVEQRLVPKEAYLMLLEARSVQS